MQIHSIGDGVRAMLQTHVTSRTNKKIYNKIFCPLDCIFMYPILVASLGIKNIGKTGILSLLFPPSNPPVLLKRVVPLRCPIQ
jgi:hypothetical protein